MTKRDRQRAVRRGIKLLDKTLGKGWKRYIKRRDLDLSASRYIVGRCGCVLAQLDLNHPMGTGTGSYREMAEVLQRLAGESVGASPNAERYGFDAAYDNSDDLDYEGLNKTWREELRR